AVQTAIPIGFTFNYLGTNYTDLGATTNGAAGFVGMTNTRFNTDLYTTTAPNAILAPWWDDLSSPVGTMLYQTQGLPGAQTFTMQWSALSYYTGSTATVNFQIILYEGTNVIEYRYGAQPTGTFNTGSESAAIGMKSQTGGNGQYLDAVTGSAFTGNATLSSQTMWPSRHFRFTPGVPTPVAGGTYTVGNAGTYFSLSEAIADLNHRGVSGAVNLSLLDANYDASPANGDNYFPMMIGPVAGTSAVNMVTIQPASGTSTITAAGFTQTLGFCVNQANVNTIGTGNEPILAVVGGQYIAINNINLVASSANIDRGLAVLNSSATLGAQFCLFTNISVTLNRSNTAAIAIEQRLPTTPTAATGANSNNSYLNLTISNTYAGMNMTGNATFPDLGLNIGTTSPTAFNSIGAATANDIGNGGTASYGILVANCSGFNIFNNEVRNVTVTGAVASDGIVITGAMGTSSCYRNKIHDIRSTSTSATTAICGIRGGVATTGTHSLRIYNNFVYGLTTAYTGAATATRQIRGINILTGGVIAANIDVDFNNVSINVTSNPNASSTCFEIASATGPVINVRNNVFSNSTGAQTAPAGHYTWVSSSATLTGNTGSVSNYNDLYVLNTTQGFVGRGATTDYATLANWQAAMTQDANSISVDPSYVSASDLHVSNPLLNAAGTPLAWVTSDIDNQVRGGTPDIGADEFVVATLDAGASVLVTPVSASCYTATQAVVVRIRNFAVLPLDLTVNNVTVTCNITGAATATLNVTLTNNALNAGVPIPSGASIDVPVGTFNMTAAGTYTFNGFTTLSGDANPFNDAMPASNISFQPGTVTAVPPTVCQGGTSTITLTGNTASSLQWEASTDGGLTWAPIVGATTSPYVATPTDTTLYRALVCGVITSTSDTVLFFPTTPPVTVSDTICGIDTVMLSASGPGTLYWFTGPSGGSPINTGTTYSPLVSATTTYYVESSSGAGTQNVGPLNTSIGTGLQSTAPQWLVFDVIQACQLQSVVVFPGAAGNVVLEWRNSSGGVIQSSTMAVTAAQVGTGVVMPLNWSLVPGTAYRLGIGAGSVTLFRNDAGAVYPYTIPGVVSITGNSFSSVYYYWGYNWSVASGCSSARVPVTAEVLPAAPVSITASSGTLCSGDSATLVASSTNLGYNYTWSPAATLNVSTGDTVMAGPSAATSFIVTADSAGCIAMDTITIAVNPLPFGSVTIADTLICINESDTLWSVDPFVAPFINTTPVPVPDANPAGATSVINIPYAATINPTMSMQVCFNMPHTYDGDMSFMLISPLGTQLDLCSNNGAGGDNFTQTCFSMSAVTPITAGVPPFTGSFLPEGAGGLDVFNGESTQGNWTLFMVDGAGGDLGTLTAWTMSFTTNNAVSWTSNPVGFTSTNDTIMVSPLVTTDYILTLTDTTTGCSTSYTRTVVVNPPLSLAMSNDTLVCAGDSAALMAMGSGGDSNIAYSWSNGPVTANNTVSPGATTMYYVTISDGCTTPIAMDSVLVTIPTPVMIASISNDTTLCSGTNLVLGVNAAGGDGNTSYAWSNGPVTANDTINTGAPGTTTPYSVMIMDGCGTSATDTVQVTTYGLLNVVVAMPDTSVVCSGDTLVGVVMAAGGDNNLSFQWSNGPTTVNDTTVTTSITTYVVTVTDGCGTTGIDSFTVDVFAPVMVTASNDTAVCFPNFAYFSSNVTGGDGNVTYQWTTGSTSNVDSSAFFGTTTVSVTVTDGCGSTSVDSILVTVNFSPSASFTESAVGSTVTFTNTSTNATSYLWNFGDTQMSTLMSPAHTYASNGTYTVTLIVTNSCGSDTITSVVMIDVGINDPAVMQGVNVYPNPSSDVFNVNFGMAIGGNVTIELFDVQGKLLQSQNSENVVAGSVMTLNVANYESGMYLMRITTSVGVQTYKLNVQK
ncbi:MAG TPA: PKD domain-containing protein, partial [Bacteroidia bacterium]|nr:PKD domain-containing protein [Bacteroidia bacterium]